MARLELWVTKALRELRVIMELKVFKEIVDQWVAEESWVVRDLKDP